MAATSSSISGVAHKRLAAVVCAAAIISILSGAAVVAAAAADVAAYSIPAFNANTTDDYTAFSNTAFLTSSTLLFEHDDALSSEFNRSEGFLVLPGTVDFWRAGPSGIPVLEASFNTSFTVAGAAPVAFVVLRDTYPAFRNPGGLRGFANYSASDSDGVTARNASGRLASVEAGAVRSYGPDHPAVGLNVTVTLTPHAGAAPSRAAVWIEYHAAARRVFIYLAAAGEARPASSLLDAPLYLPGDGTTETAFVGFFAGAIQDIIVGVRDWDLTVDRFPGEGDGKKKGTAWWVILLAVLGSVAGAAAIVAAVVLYLQSRRRRQLSSMEPKM